ncbi:tRNA-binding protein [Candidatus Dependentiae bacterium]|nr:tRNA-binding protein [Candidatus Dependentiae bacterium]
MITYEDFIKIEINSGTIIKVEDFPQARKPAYKLTIDFGEKLGIKYSSAQITNYKKEDLIGKQIIAVTNFPEKQIGPFKSQVLVLGLPSKSGQVILLSPDEKVENGERLF